MIKSANQESSNRKIKQSTNHPIKVGICCGSCMRDSPSPGEWKRAYSIRKGRGFNSPPQA